MRSLLLFIALAASTARAAPPRPISSPLWLVLEGVYAAPGGEPSRGPGGALRLGYRFTDQLSSAVGFETLFARGGPVTGLSAGFEATLDSTPIAPFLELSLVRADPVSRAGFSLAQRTGFGADWRLSRAVALGAVVRYFSPLDNEAPLGGTSLAGIELAFRLVLIPGAF